MEFKDYLIVYGQNVQHNLPCYKETEISCNDLIKYTDIIKKIIENLDKEYNWAWGTDLILNKNKYVNKYRIVNMYPDIDFNRLIEFSNYLPGGITKIESIKIFSGQKVKII